MMKIEQWQLIETAPKDGSWFLTYENGKIQENAWFNFDVLNHSHSDEYKKWFNGLAPTHWISFPPPPTL